MLPEHLKKLAEDLDIKEGLKPQDGGVSIIFDDAEVFISDAESGFQFSSTFCEIPSEQQELFFAKMLRGNLFFQATNGSTLGLDETGLKLLLRYCHPYKCTYRDLKEKLEDFLNTLEFWKEEVKSHQQNPLAA